ncbi:MAG TPA: hypothetical protein VHA13_03440, partial [Gammaproteobacteria bacterium]|nr:hypothetical protein [Gammaproteobacteria bacterium]
VLTDCDALPKLFPELVMNSLGMHALLKVIPLSEDAQVRFAALLHHLKQDSIKALSARYRIPSDYRDLALLVERHLREYQNAAQLSPPEIVNLLQSVDAFRREDRFNKFLTACEAASKQNNSEWLRQCYVAAKSINVRELIDAGFANLALAEKIKEMREKAIQLLK